MQASVRRGVPVRDAGDVGNLDDIARATEDAVGKRASRAGGNSIRSADVKAVDELLLRNVVALDPFLLQLPVLLFSPLLDPEAPDDEHDQCHKRYSAHHSAGDGAHVPPVRVGCRRWVLDTGHVRAFVAVVGDERADLAGGA